MLDGRQPRTQVEVGDVGPRLCALRLVVGRGGRLPAARRRARPASHFSGRLMRGPPAGGRFGSKRMLPGSSTLDYKCECAPGGAAKYRNPRRSSGPSTALPQGQVNILQASRLQSRAAGRTPPETRPTCPLSRRSPPTAPRRPASLPTRATCTPPPAPAAVPCSPCSQTEDAQTAPRALDLGRRRELRPGPPAPLLPVGAGRTLPPRASAN